MQSSHNSFYNAKKQPFPAPDLGPQPDWLVIQLAVARDRPPANGPLVSYVLTLVL